jgi:hypothetical protein
MRIAILAVIAIGCGGHAGSPALPAPEAAGFPAARWVPARPTYLFTSRTMDDAQQQLRDAIDLVGTAVGGDLRDVTRAVEALIGVDALHADPLAAIGVDLRGSWAVFSEELNPTFVIHLAAPDQMAAFFEGQRARGLVTQSVIVDGTEVFSATLPGGVIIRWAIAGDWMWVHFALPFTHEDGTRWFTASHAPHGNEWGGTWTWAQRAGKAAAGLVGFLDLHGAIGDAVARIPGAMACVKLVEPVGRVAMAVEGDEHHVAARIAVDVGSTTGIRSLILPAPTGWDAAAAHAAIAAQWNLDLTAVRSYLAPCLATARTSLAMLDETSVRTARGMLLDFDPGAMTGSGAVALDITSPAFFDRQLDRIPLRRTLSSARTFGAYKGVSISIPFSVTIEYVLDPRLAIAALGEGLLARLVAPGAPGQGAPPPPPPMLALDLAPPAMSAEAWAAVLQALAEQSLAGSPGPATRRAVSGLLRWRDIHLAVTADAAELAFTASADRR